MEHRLILGGEQFLPFARSCVAKLKKLGLPYADQSYEVDGVSIKVRIEPGHEYIRLEGGASIALDSGVVDLVNTGINAEGRFSPGVLHETDGVEAYNAKFTDHRIGYRLKPGKNDGQLSGVVTYDSSIKGKILDDAMSFMPKKVPSEDDPRLSVLSKDDEDLFYKKLIVSLCPASMFTGRCRAYVQAMYGTPMEHFRKSRPGLILTSVGPTLKLDTYPKGADKPAVTLTTSSGVYLDADTGDHYLFLLGGEQMAVYPLVSNAAGEKLRRLLVAGSKPVLSALDKEHLEAYILAYSLPDLSRKQTAVGSVVGGGSYSMGYGWHWNYSGTEAQIVHNVEHEREDHKPVMRSTRYQINVNKVPSGSDGSPSEYDWLASAVIAEGPEDWAVPRIFWCIAEPDWESGGLLKSTPKYNTPLFPCSAPFYVFYKGDVAQVCRITISLHAADPAEREYSPPFFASPGYGNPATENTDGLLGGHMAQRVGFIDYFSCTLDCAGVNVTDLFLGRSYAETGITITEKTPGASPAPSTQGFSPPYADQYFPFGYQNDGGSYARIGPIKSYGVGGALVEVSYKRHSDTVDGNYPSVAAVAVPLYDAEAILVYAKSVHVRNTGRSTSLYKAFGFIRGYTPYHVIEVPAPGTNVYYWGSTISPPQYFRSGPGSAAITQVGSEAEETTTEDVIINTTKIAGAAGVLDIYYPALLPLLANGDEDTVALELKALASASQAAPAVIVPSLVKSGTSFAGTPSAFIGWA